MSLSAGKACGHKRQHKTYVRLYKSISTPFERDVHYYAETSMRKIDSLICVLCNVYAILLCCSIYMKIFSRKE